MSLPPPTIHIKRKATDDPVDFLRVHELNSKRQRRASEFIFTRQTIEKEATQSQPTPAGVRHIKELPRVGSVPPLSSPATKPTEKREGRSEVVADQASEPLTPSTNTIVSQQTSTDNAFKDRPIQVARQRRFHISRTPTPTQGQSPVIGGRIQKRTPTVFVERRSRPTSSKGANPLNTNIKPSIISISSSQKDKSGLIATPAGQDIQTSTIVTTEAGQSRPQKKPGLAARTPLNGTSSIPTTPLTPSAPARNVRLPSGLVMPWDVTSDQLAKEMQEYTLQQIGLSIAETQTESPKPAFTPAPRKITKSKFKPKKPAARYHERHPEDLMRGSGMDVDDSYLHNNDLDDDGDYVIDTYIRIPAYEVASDKQNDFGLLVLESQPDFEEFYREYSDHDTEEEDEEEDENAEDHYTADYPEDEVDSDDEYNRNAYHYRNNNASDDEEYDKNDDDDDDDDDNTTRYPWSKSKQPYGAGLEEYDDDDVDKHPFHDRAVATHDPLAKIFKGLTTSEEKHEHQGVVL